MIEEKTLSIDKSGWTPVKFGDVAKEPKESVKDAAAAGIEHVVGLGHIDSENVHLRRSASIEESTTFTKKFSRGDVLFGRRRAYLKKAAQAEFEGICSGDITVMRAKEDLLPDLLPFIVQNEKFFDYAIEHSAGGLSPRVKFKDLANYEFLLPPKEQQAELAEFLWAMDTVVEKSLRVLDALSRLQQTTFKEQCVLSKTSKEYKVKDLLIDGPRNGYSPKASIDNTGSKTVSIGAIKEGIFDPEGNIKYAKVDDEILQKFDIQKSDVFVVRGNGNKKLCGRAGLSLEGYSNLFYPDLLIRLRFNPNLVLPDFAVLLWNSLKTHSNLLRRAKSTNGIWKINGDDIKRHKMLVPSISEQASILSEINRVNKVVTECTCHLPNTNCLQKSLINQVF